ncbi:hypothetical protein KIN20_023465 [Parelaphostrongylus tenuis]|uniref:Uncharacterized protein n=1 Tax=Parelaphostrongylus tenuis TaxID=148309 RepID=A0AAD5QXD3_PARTN|nr:hypothetical protein KIN20_023465 [Parelaphostrongylus tenuis]
MRHKKSCTVKASSYCNVERFVHLAQILHYRKRFASLSPATIRAQAGADTKAKAMIQDFRDKVEVAHIQMAIKESMNVHTQRQQEVVKLLDGPILPLQELLQKFSVCR